MGLTLIIINLIIKYQVDNQLYLCLFLDKVINNLFSLMQENQERNEVHAHWMTSMHFKHCIKADLMHLCTIFGFN